MCYLYHPMSLGIALKGPEGIVLAADSRVTLFSQTQIPNAPQQYLIPASFDNATKLLRVEHHNYVAAVTYGQGALGQQQPRTAHSFLPEFDQELGPKRVKVQEFAKKLGEFFLRQWQAANMPAQVDPSQEMVFLVGGYSEKEPYGELYEIHIPTTPVPTLRVPVSDFGMVWGGQRNITDRIVQGYDSALLGMIYDALNIPQAQRNPAALEVALKTQLQLKMPIQFLPLQDCVDYVIFLIRSTILLQKWIIDIRGVGGAVDVVTITREGVTPIQLKQIIGEQVK